MLEQMRRNSRSFIIWILFGIIIAVFIISFGPQASPDSLGCAGQSKTAALEVDGQSVSLNSWRFAMNALRGGGGGPGQMGIRRQQAVDSLVERELLAQAAQDQGFRMSDDAVNLAMSTGEFLILGQFIRQDDPKFLSDYQQLENFANGLGLTNVRQLIDEQRREHMAEMMRQLLIRSATVSDEEARQVYVNQNTRITADYVKFDQRRYRSALQLTEADLDRYMSGHEADLKKAWETEKTQWATDKPRVLARLIFIARDAAEKPGAKPGQAKPGEAKPGDPAAAAGKKPGAAEEKVPARKRAEAAQARLAAGGDFGAVAREVSEDRPSLARGGLLGWRPADSLGQGKEVVEAVKKLAVHTVSDVIEGERGYYIVRVEERSDKALTYEQKRLDLAFRVAPDYYARALAKRDADKAIAMAATRPLDELFERKRDDSSPSTNDLPPEVLEQLEQLKGQGIDVRTVPPGGMTTGGEEGEEGAGEEGGATAPVEDGKQGFIVREGPNVLAQSGGTPAPAPAPAGKPAAPAGAAPAPAGKPAAPAGAAPAPAGKPAAPGAAPAGAAPAAGSGETLPEVTVDKPGLDTVGPVARMGDFVPGVGKSEKLVTDLFEKLEEGKIAPEAYELPDGFAVVVLKDREDADVAKFDESRPELVEQLAYQKGLERVSDWVTRRCEETSKKGEIKVSRELFEDEKGEKGAEQAGYQPCATLGARFGGRRSF